MINADYTPEDIYGRDEEEEENDCPICIENEEDHLDCEHDDEDRTEWAEDKKAEERVEAMLSKTNDFDEGLA